MYTVRPPGTCAYVNRNLIEAVMLGAVAHFKVSGDWDNQLFQQISAPALF
jgi:nitrite reductase (NO-forming)